MSENKYRTEENQYLAMGRGKRDSKVAEKT